MVVARDPPLYYGWWPLLLNVLLVRLRRYHFSCGSGVAPDLSRRPRRLSVPRFARSRSAVRSRSDQSGFVAQTARSVTKPRSSISRSDLTRCAISLGRTDGVTKLIIHPES